MVDYSGSAATFRFDKIIFRMDNTTPNVKIMTPQASEQVLKRINISAITSGIHLNSYRVNSSTDQEGKSWEPIYLQAGLYQKSEDVLLPKPKLKTAKINRDWEIPILAGPVWVWLTATNIATHIARLSKWKHLPTVVTRKGGIISPQDQQVELYFPPNTLAQGEIVTVNVITKVGVGPRVRLISWVYDFAPTT